MTKQGDDGRTEGRLQLEQGTMIKQGADDKARGRWQSRGTMTKQGYDDKAGGR